MRRRQVLGRIATGGLAAVGVSGVVSADQELVVVWERDDGTVRRLTASEFDRHPATPRLEALASDCCDCPDDMTCECRYPDCETAVL